MFADDECLAGLSFQLFFSPLFLYIYMELRDKHRDLDIGSSRL